LGVKRGDIVTVAPPGEYGKPRPALVLQDIFDTPAERVTVALITSDLLRIPNLRVPLKANEHTGLRLPSEVAVDKVQTLSLHKIGKVVGFVDSETLSLIDDALMRHLGLYQGLR
jgi:mRNA interferase MazF